MQAIFFQSTAVHKELNLDPRTKLYLLLVTNIVIISGSSGAALIYIKPLLSAIPFLLLLMSGRRKAALLYALVYAVSWLLSMVWIPYLTGLPGILLALFSELGRRWLPCGMMGYYLFATTRVSEFLAAMERMHVTQNITIPFSVMFRFFPTVAEESRSISDAMRMRGVGIRSFSGNPTAMLEYRLVPLIMSVVKIGNELSAAALTRGLGGPGKRTNICKIGFGAWDVLFALLATAVLAAYILL